MQRLPNSPIRIQFGLRGWAATAVGTAILAAISFLAIGFIIFILPVVLLGSILFLFLPKPTLYQIGIPSEKPPVKGTTIIEGEFSVIDGTSDDKLKPPGTLAHDN